MKALKTVIASFGVILVTLIANPSKTQATKYFLQYGNFSDQTVKEKITVVEEKKTL